MKQDIVRPPKNQQDLASDIELFKNEIRNMQLAELNLITTKLNYLCDKIDPYDLRDEQPIEIENILKEFNLNNTLVNPFVFTNRLLQYLDLTQNRSKELLQ